LSGAEVWKKATRTCSPNSAGGQLTHTSDALIFFKRSVRWLLARSDSSALDIGHLKRTDFTISKESSREDNDARPFYACSHNLNGLGGCNNSWKNV
jgi:hypothetical protein